MISITCTHCKTVLTIDDAFAGGACRCQHCGTIQTVPIQLKNTASAVPYVNPSATTSKALYQNKTASRGSAAAGAVATSSSPSGLDDLANAVHSSGLAGSGLRGSGGAVADPAVPATPQAQAATGAAAAVATTRKKNSLMLPMVGGGALAVVVIAVVAFLAFRGAGGSSGSGSGGGGSNGSSAAFCGVPMTGTSSVIYVLDRANSMTGDFDPLKAATFQSITTLGADRKFAVILWNNDGDDVAFPAEGLRNATSDQIELCKTAIGGVVATGASHLRGALERAAARQPSAIVIATAKSKFGDDDVQALSNFKDTTGGKIKIFAFVIGGTGENDLLKISAQATGGQYRPISSKDLQSATSP